MLTLVVLAAVQETVAALHIQAELEHLIKVMLAEIP
jgi:hypothetical protein